MPRGHQSTLSFIISHTSREKVSCWRPLIQNTRVCLSNTLIVIESYAVYNILTESTDNGWLFAVCLFVKRGWETPLVPPLHPLQLARSPTDLHFRAWGPQMDQVAQFTAAENTENFFLTSVFGPQSASFGESYRWIWFTPDGAYLWSFLRRWHELRSCPSNTAAERKMWPWTSSSFDVSCG